MKSIEKRLRALELEPGNDCPFCNYISLDGWPEDRLRELIDALDGKCTTVSPELEKFLSEIPESSPTCPHCQKTTSMSEEELDNRMVKLADILRDAI